LLRFARNDNIAGNNSVLSLRGALANIPSLRGALATKQSRYCKN